METELVEPVRERRLRTRQMQQTPVVAGVADEDPAEELLAVLAPDELLVDAAHLIFERDDARLAAILERIAEGRDIRAEELQLRGEIAAAEERLITRQVLRERVGHLVAGGDEAVDHLAMKRDLAR